MSRSAGDSSTQSDGVFGLLDEWCAYYHGSHTTVDLWPWVRDEAPRHPDVISDYVASLHKIGQPYAEFKLYILHYLAHERRNVNRKGVWRLGPICPGLLRGDRHRFLPRARIVRADLRSDAVL